MLEPAEVSADPLLNENDCVELDLPLLLPLTSLLPQFFDFLLLLQLQRLLPSHLSPLDFFWVDTKGRRGLHSWRLGLSLGVLLVDLLASACGLCLPERRRTTLHGSCAELRRRHLPGRRSCLLLVQEVVQGQELLRLNGRLKRLLLLHQAALVVSRHQRERGRCWNLRVVRKLLG